MLGRMPTDAENSKNGDIKTANICRHSLPSDVGPCEPKSAHSGLSQWTLSLEYHINGLGAVHIRCLSDGDELRLIQFARSLGQTSQEYFCPYPWSEADALWMAVSAAIRRNRAGEEASYLVLLNDLVIGHFALWGIKKRIDFRGRTLDVPTLGIAVADEFQGRGVGTFCLHLVADLGHNNRVDAIELTVAESNLRAARLYRKTGFVDCGVLRIPLGVDPSTELSKPGMNTPLRDERHMCLVVESGSATLLLKYMKEKGYRSLALGADR